MRPRTYRLLDALQRREIQLEKIIECVGEDDKFYPLYAMELRQVINTICELSETTEI